MMQAIKDLAYQRWLMRKIGKRSYLRYLTQKSGALSQITIRGTQVWVRKGSSDIAVAISCLTGEFDILGHLYPRDWDGVIVDAGGYIGAASIAFAKMYPKARIITIEPSQENMTVLRKNIEGYDNITPIYGALTTEDVPSITLNDRGTGNWGFTIISRPDDTPDAKAMHEVPGVHLSTLGVPISEVGILKLDIEGGEYDILTKEGDQLDQVNALIIELHDRIKAGCSDAFFAYSKDRITLKDKGEKYVSIRRAA